MLQRQRLTINPTDLQNLYKKDCFTDDKSGQIFELVPVMFEEDEALVFDPIRKNLYEGMTYIQGSPVQFKIPAETLKQAMELFAPTLMKVMEEAQSQAMRQALAAPPEVGGLDLSRMRRT
jgi:hypothetical protein